jgi:hydroxyacylglutathione hydrolase
MVHVRPVRAFADNYIWLIDSVQHPGKVAVVDPGAAIPVIAELERSGQALAAILLTHHHADHIGGVAELLSRAKVPVIGPEDARIAHCSQTVRDYDQVRLPELGLDFQTLHVPGHTLSHVAFWGHGSLFCGDTLFSAGCGRMFEGTAPQMNASLNRLRALPPNTRVYCGHEYTQANLRFAAAVEPDNLDAQAYRQNVKQLRDADQPSLPSTLELEIRVNPFLRCDVPGVRVAAATHEGTALSEDHEVFGALRRWKDGFS